MSMLLSKIYMLEEQKREEEIAKQKGEKISAGWEIKSDHMYFSHID